MGINPIAFELRDIVDYRDISRNLEDLSMRYLEAIILKNLNRCAYDRPYDESVDEMVGRVERLFSNLIMTNIRNVIKEDIF